MNKDQLKQAERINLSNISTKELIGELKDRRIDCYPANLAFVAGIKFPITNRKHLGKEPLPYKTEYKK